MNWHIINGRMTHLSPIIISSILNYSGATNKNGAKSHYFYIADYGKAVGSVDNMKEIYAPVFKKFDVPGNYEFVSSSFRMIFLLLTKNLSNSLMFIHGTITLFFYPVIYTMILLLRSSRHLNRICLVAWGQGDFYYTRNKYIRKLSNALYTVFIRKIRCLLTISETDYDLAKSLHKNANVGKCSYMKEIDDYPVVKDSGELLIVVSHSGWQHNKHILSLKLLEHLKDEKIRIICPLCYGDELYIKSVIEEGKKIFKEKFTYFTELKTLEEYTALLNSAHVYISAASIQTGLFAINTSILGGANVFLSENLTEKYSQDGYFVRNLLEVSDLKYSDLISINPDNRRSNLEKMRDEIDRNIEIWKGIYI